MDPHAQTVRGPVDVAELGITLMHEHCIVDLSHHLEPSSDPELGSYYDRPVTMDLLGTLRRHPLDICRDNVLLDDAELAVAELELYAAKGGKTVVDRTPFTAVWCSTENEEVIHWTGRARLEGDRHVTASHIRLQGAAP